MSSFFALNIDEFVRNSNGTFGLRYVSEIMCKIPNCSSISTITLTIRAVSVTVVVVAISLFFGFCWNLFLKSITYCKNSLRHFGGGAKKILISILKLFGLIMVFPLLYVLSVFSYRRRRRSHEERFFEERRKRRSERSRSDSTSDSDEIIVIEESSPPPRRRREYSRGRPYRSSKPTSYSIFAGLFSIFGLQSKSDIVVVERYSGRRSDPPRRYQTGWFGGRQRRRSESLIVEERYTRRGSTSSGRRWYGDYERHSAPKRNNWLPWNWFRKMPMPVQRRGRAIRVENEPSPSGLKRVYAWLFAHFIAPLLRLFGVTKPTLVEERASYSSSYFSYEYGSGTNSHASSSIRGSEARSRHTRRSRR